MPSNRISETIQFEPLQYTAVYQHDSIKSEEVNKLLLSLGVGENFLSSEFGIKLEYVEHDDPCVYAVLKPGICVLDTTLINFQDVMDKDDKIYIKLYSANTVPGPNTIIYVGSQYYHGTQGDGINAKPTFAKLLKTLELKYYDNFVPWYRISILPGFTGVTDLTHVTVERVIPHIKHDGPGGPVDYISIGSDGLKTYALEGSSEDSDAFIWALVFGK